MLITVMMTLTVPKNHISLADTKNTVEVLHYCLLCNVDQEIARDVKHKAYKIKMTVCKIFQTSTHK